METKGGFLISRIKHVGTRIFDRKLAASGIDSFNGAQGRILYVLWQNDHISISSLSAHGTGRTMLTRGWRHPVSEPVCSGSRIARQLHVQAGGRGRPPPRDAPSERSSVLGAKAPPFFGFFAKFLKLKFFWFLRQALWGCSLDFCD